MYVIRMHTKKIKKQKAHKHAYMTTYSREKTRIMLLIYIDHKRRGEEYSKYIGRRGNLRSKTKSVHHAFR